jgi:hypothetical protein
MTANAQVMNPRNLCMYVQVPLENSAKNANMQTCALDKNHSQLQSLHRLPVNNSLHTTAVRLSTTASTQSPRRQEVYLGETKKLFCFHVLLFYNKMTFIRLSSRHVTFMKPEASSINNRPAHKLKCSDESSKSWQRTINVCSSFPL